MKAFVIKDKFGLDSLTLEDRPEPRPGPGQVLLRMKAASLNFRDLLTIRGLYNPKQPLPLVPFSDGVGEVVEIGAGVSRVKVGERVAPIFDQNWLSGEMGRRRATLGGPLDGTLAELMVLHEEGVVPVPSHMSDEEAATLPCAAVTAWSALVTEGNIKAGDTVLVQGTGGVSIFALQFARLSGARVIITSSSDEKLERAKELGASDGINYKANPDWHKRVRELTDGRGVDHVVEVGGAGTFSKSLTSARTGGTVSVIGILSGTAGQIDLIPILMQKLRVQGIMVGSRETFEAMIRAIALHRLKPVVDRVFPFAEAKAACEFMAAGGFFGKICIRIS